MLRKRPFAGTDKHTLVARPHKLFRSDTFPPDPGAYVLSVRLDCPLEVTARGLPAVCLLPGWYAYAGSARGPGGLAGRLNRHVSPHKRPRWHVDSLTLAAAEIEALAVPGAEECDLLRRLLALPGASIPLPGFGASDCKSCPAHLVALGDQPAADIFAPD